jgi:phosphoribosyl 1,2-cyclic phosphodiesterase
VRARFWGVRGSVSFATPRSIGHGCNTACVEIRNEQTGAVLILDAGSGIVGLGDTLGHAGAATPILLTHYHWDHIQGLPFFAPFYQPDRSPVIWAPALGTIDQAFVETIFQSPFFPVPFLNLPSRPNVQLFGAGELNIDGFCVRVQPLSHPGGAVAFRIQGDAGDVVFATDHEFGDPEVDEALAAFCLNASAVILDAHFTPEELPRHKGWGHGSWRQCADFAAANGAGHLWLFHHKPGRTDEAMATIQSRARHVFPATTAASEGATFEF